jgi:large subunit ribosomal protein L10
MSKTVKSMISRDYAKRFGDCQDALVVSLRGLKAIDTNKLRRAVSKDKVKITVVRNSLARRALKEGPLSGLAEFLTGPSALAYGGSAVEVARAIVEKLKDYPGLELKGAILDGNLFKGKSGVEELSKYPTRGEAIGQAVTLLISPGRKLAGQILGPGRNIGGIVKAIEAKLEKGEAIAKKA